MHEGDTITYHADMATPTTTKRRRPATAPAPRSTRPDSRRPGPSSETEPGLLAEYAAKVWDGVIEKYHADPRDNWAKNIALIRSLCPIEIPIEEMADRTLEPDPRNPGRFKKVARSTYFLRIAGDRPRTGETQVRAMARGLGVPTRILWSEDPWEVISYVRENFPEFFLDFSRNAGASSESGWSNARMVA